MSVCSVLTFCTRWMRVSCVRLASTPRRMCSRSRRDHVADRHPPDRPIPSTSAMPATATTTATALLADQRADDRDHGHDHGAPE